MKTNKTSLLIIFAISLITTTSCKKAKSEKELEDIWNVTAWNENGTIDSEVPSYGIKLVFSDVKSGAGIMTIYSEGIEDENFNYTGDFTIDDDNHINSTIDETTNNSEINQMIFSVDAEISASQLNLNGSIVKKSPFWPDNTVTVSISATK